MAYPRWLAKINRAVFNKREVRRNRYPVLTHIGRKSGRKYQTPMDAFPTDAGFVCVVRYGPQSDWVQNVLQAGEATLLVEGVEHRLARPRVVGEAEAVDAGFERPEKFAKAADFLLLDAA